MLKDFIINAGMLVSFTSVIYQIFRNSGLNPRIALKYRILSGIIFGFLGVILMIFGIKFPNNLVIDFRNLALILSTFCGGWVSGVISAIIIPIFRILIYGINKPTMFSIIVIEAIMVVTCIISSLKMKRILKWFVSVGISEILSFIGFYMVVSDVKLRQELFIEYSISLTLISILLYFYMEYLDTLTESYLYYKKEANRDFLTGLNNVRQFDKIYNRINEAEKEKNEIVSLLYIDIDFFKKVNDTYGHKEGDIVLKKISDILVNTCRSTDFISRNGGEEFSVILLNCPPYKAMEIAEGIRKNVENTPIKLSNNIKINITISIGVSSYPDSVGDFEKLREKADEALYEAKHKGRNNVVFSHK